MPLRKVCRRPETDYRLQQLHAIDESATKNQHKTVADARMGSSLRVYPPAEATQKQHTTEESAADATVVVPSASAVTEPEIAEIVTSSNMGNSNATPDNDAVVMSDTDTNTISGGSQIITGSNMGNSNTTQGNDAVMSDTATNTISGGSGEDFTKG